MKNQDTTGIIPEPSKLAADLKKSLMEKEDLRQIREEMHQYKKEHLLQEKNRRKQIKEDYKKERLQNKIATKDTQEQLKNKHHLFRRKSPILCKPHFWFT